MKRWCESCQEAVELDINEVVKKRFYCPECGSDTEDPPSYCDRCGKGISPYKKDTLCKECSQIIRYALDDAIYKIMVDETTEYNKALGLLREYMEETEE